MTCISCNNGIHKPWKCSCGENNCLHLHNCPNCGQAAAPGQSKDYIDVSTLITKPPTNYRSFINHCRREYGYEWVGRDKEITTALSGTTYLCYFREIKTGELHCISHSKYVNGPKMREAGRKIVFSW